MVRPTIMYVSECWAVDRIIEQRMSIATSRYENVKVCIYIVSIEEKIRNEYTISSIYE